MQVIENMLVWGALWALEGGWVALLVLALPAAALAVLLPGRWVRGGLAAVALAAAAPLLTLLWLLAAESLESRSAAAEREAFEATLDAPAVVDGLALPAGARLRWDDRARTRLSGVTLEDGAVLGLRAVRFLLRESDDLWQAGVDAAQEVDSWPCDDDGHLWVDGRGRFQGCTLSRAHAFHGWTLPAGAQVMRRRLDQGELSVAGPSGAWDGPTPAGDAGGVLSGGPVVHFALHESDGSMSGASFREESPLLLGGVALHGWVRWVYDPATEGMGRARPPLALRGDGAQGRVTVPWPGVSGAAVPAARP